MPEPCGRALGLQPNILNLHSCPGHLTIYFWYGFEFFSPLYSDFRKNLDFGFGAFIHLLNEITFVLNMFCTKYYVHSHEEMKDKLCASQSLMEKAGCVY